LPQTHQVRPHTRNHAWNTGYRFQYNRTMAVAFLKEGIRKKAHAFRKGQSNPVGHRNNLVVFHGKGWLR
jgi:hypothetical protein